MKDTQTDLAIKAAFDNDWEKAITLNQQILEKDPEDIDALNRLGFAQIQSENLAQAKKVFNQVLTIDKYNSIAKKNLERIKSIPKKKQTTKAKNQQRTSFALRFFIEEPGKTRIVNVINPAPAKVLSSLNVGDNVYLHPRKRSIEVRNAYKQYLGALPDDVAFRLLKFLKASNQYQVRIKKIQSNNLTVFIREIKRGKRLAHQSTFALSTNSIK